MSDHNNNNSGVVDYDMAIVIQDKKELERKRYLTSNKNKYRDRVIYSDIIDNIKENTFKVRISKSFLFGNTTDGLDEGYVDILRSLHEEAIEQNETCVVPQSIETLIKAYQSNVVFNIINTEDHFKIYYILRKYIQHQSSIRDQYKDLPNIDQNEEYNTFVQHIDFSNRLYQELETKCFAIINNDTAMGDKYPDFSGSTLDRLMALNGY